MSMASLGTLLRHIQHLAAGPGARPDTDRQLLDLFADRGDQAAFTALVSRHGPMVLRVCRRVLHHEQDAEDAFQATFLVLAGAARSIRRRDTVASWLHGVAYRTAMKAKRSAARRRNHETRRAAEPAKVAGPTWDDVQAVLDEEIERLPPRFREAFVRCMLEGKGGREAAAELGCKEATLKTRVNRARRQLRSRLTHRGIHLSALLAALSVAERSSRAAVPTLLSRATVRFGLSVAAGQPGGAGIPAHIAALAAGVTRAMALAKAKVAVVLVVAVGLLAAAGVLACQALADKAQRAGPPAKAEQPGPGNKPAPRKIDRDSVTCSGRVLRPDGKPLAGAKVFQAFAVEFIDHHPPPAPKPRGTTGRDGQFHFTVPRAELASDPKAVLQVVAVADGFGPDWVRLDKPDQRPLTLRLVRDDVPISGRILDLEGRPVRGTTVRPLMLMTTPDEDLTPWLRAIKANRRFQHREMLKKQLFGFPQGVPGLPRTVTTGADGRFRLAGVGRERVVVLRIGGPKVRQELAVVVTRAVPKFRAFDNPTTDTKFTVYGATFDHVAAPAQPLVGTVRDRDTGKPLAGVRIDAETLSPVITDRQGKYRLDSLPDGYGERDDFGIPVLAVPPANQPYLIGFKEVKPRAGLQAVTVDFRLTRGVWVQGKVTDKVTGKPVRAYLQYHPALHNPHRKDAADFTRFPTRPAELYRTRPDGTFRVAALPGPGVVTARGPYGKYLGDGSATINPSPDAKVVQCTIALQPGRTITGTVLGPEGRPLAGVGVFNVNPLHFWSAGPLKTASFRLTGVDPRGRRSLVFLHPDKHLVKAVELRGNVRGLVTVRLEKAGTVTGRLVDEDGQPRPRVVLQIHFVRKDSGGVAEHLPPRITTDPQGRFRVDGLAAGLVYQINLAGKPVTRTIGSVAPRVSVKPGETKDLGDVKGKLFSP
jgi:RNA polymerase sigma factor (sigma-70 family)